jgi:hypothetical protein
MSLSSVLASLGLKPKNLEEARQTIEPARATLDAVNALFATAGLNLETLLAAGPESLKAHLETCMVKAEEFSALETQLSTAKTELAKLGETHATATATLATYGELFTAIGVSCAAPEAPALKTAFETHVAKQVTLANAKIGHPPVQHIDAAAGAATLAATDAEVAKTYSAMPAGPARLAFFQANAAALQRVYDAQNRRDDSA